MGVFVKICGITREGDARHVAALRPDAMGFVFWPGSRRYVKPEQVASWAGILPKEILKVGVFVNASAEELEHVRTVAGLDILQLHGNESPEFCKEPIGRIWKALNPASTTLEQAVSYPVEAFLLDNATTQVPGGTGVQTDWAKARDFIKNIPRPVLLAGGLNPENVRAAIQAVGPWGVDVSSGVELEPGIKDIDKVEAFLEECRI